MEGFVWREGVWNDVWVVGGTRMCGGTRLCGGKLCGMRCRGL